MPAYVQRVAKKSKAGNTYIDFIFTEQPPSGYAGTRATVSQKGAKARELRKGTTPTVEASTPTVEGGTTPTVVKEINRREKESFKGTSLREEPDNKEKISLSQLDVPGSTAKAVSPGDEGLSVSQLNDLAFTDSLSQLEDFDPDHYSPQLRYPVPLYKPKEITRGSTVSVEPPSAHISDLRNLDIEAILNYTTEEEDY